MIFHLSLNSIVYEVSNVLLHKDKPHSQAVAVNHSTYQINCENSHKYIISRLFKRESHLESELKQQCLTLIEEVVLLGF